MKEQRRETQPGGKVTPGPERLYWRCQRCNRRGGDWTHARYRYQPASDLALFGTAADLGVQNGDILLQRLQGHDQDLEDRPGALGQVAVRVFDLRPGTGPPPWHRSSPLTVPPLRNLPPNAIVLPN